MHMDYAKLKDSLKFPYRGDAVFAVIFFAVVFIPLIFGTYLNDTIEVPKLALWAVCMALILIFQVRQKNALSLKYNKWVFILVILFFAWSVIATIFSLDKVTSVVGLYGRFTGSVFFYGLWGLTVLVLASNLTKDKFIYLCKTLVLVGLAMGLFAIIQNQGIAYYPGPGDFLRFGAPSFLGNPNFSAMFIASILPFALLFLAQAKTMAARIYYATAAAVIIIGLAIFSSRGALLAALAALLLMVIAGMFMKQGRRFVLTYFAGIAVFLVVAGAFFVAMRPQVISQTLQLSETTVEQRFAVWDATATIIGKYPWFGTGPGNYFIGFNQAASSVFSSGGRFDDAHNLVLQLAATSGPVSAVLFLALVGLCLVYGWRIFQVSRDPLFLAALAGVIAWLISSSFTPVVTACWFLLAVLLAGLIFTDTRAITAMLPRFGRPLVVVGALLVIACSISFVASDAFARDAVASFNSNAFVRAERSARFAFYLNPANPGTVPYWAASRIKLGADPAQTKKVMGLMLISHTLSPRIHYTIALLDYLLYRQTDERAYLSDIDPQLQRALQLQPTQDAMSDQVGYLYYKTGDLAKAERYVRQSITYNPTEFYFWMLLAQLYQQQGQRAPMLGALTKAQKLEPDVVVLKRFLPLAKTEPDVKKIKLPINFPEPGI